MKLADGAERRRGLRIRQSRPVKVFDARTGRYHAAVTCDVSSSGLQVDLPARCFAEVGHSLRVHVGTGHAGQPLANRRQMIPAKIVWLRRGGEGRLRAGLEFMSHIACQLEAA
ncbi:MAG: PilZ domain-containing protein [Phycisphaerae bacterium]